MATEDKSPEEIREDIASTRSELGDTVEALGAKTDVKGRAADKVDEVKATVKDKLPGGGSGPSDGSEPSGPQAQAQAALDKVKANPLPVAVVAALVLGYLIGRRGGE